MHEVIISSEEKGGGMSFFEALMWVGIVMWSVLSALAIGEGFIRIMVWEEFGMGFLLFFGGLISAAGWLTIVTNHIESV